MQALFNQFLQEHVLPLHVSDMRYYRSLSLCALDAVMSIQLNYDRRVAPIVKRLGQRCGIPPEDIFETMPEVNEQVSVSDFVDCLQHQGLWNEEGLMTLIGRYRTAGKTSITKAAAFILFIQFLQNHRIDTYQDLNSVPEDELQALENELKGIPGQNVSVDYFFMLAGDSNRVKVDRWLTRFACEATGMNHLTNDQILNLFRNAAEQLVDENGNHYTPRHLDHMAWDYQRGR